MSQAAVIMDVQHCRTGMYLGSLETSAYYLGKFQLTCISGSYEILVLKMVSSCDNRFLQLNICVCFLCQFSWKLLHPANAPPTPPGTPEPEIFERVTVIRNVSTVTVVLMFK
jgi:hypothetical protein